MRGVFDDDKFEEPESQRDAELTLGAGMLLLLFFGLVLVCGFCFAAGYAVGRRGAPPAAAGQQSAGSAQTPVTTGSSLPKPLATTQPPAAQASTSTTPPGDASPSGAAGAAPSTAAATPPASNPAAAPSAPPKVRPDPAPAVKAPSAVPTPAAHPASPPAPAPPAVPLMVQIAAVSHQEDADVLVGALRKHGYTVAARRDPADSLIHVRIGPFSNRDDANRWRTKLLNDGYNAMIQP